MFEVWNDRLYITDFGEHIELQKKLEQRIQKE